MQQLVFLPVAFGLMYLFLIRPQQRRVRQQRALLDVLDVGDAVMTGGGIFGTIAGFEDDGERVRVEIAPGVVVEILRLAIARRIEPEGGFATGAGFDGATDDGTTDGIGDGIGDEGGDN